MKKLSPKVKGTSLHVQMAIKTATCRQNGIHGFNAADDGVECLPFLFDNGERHMSALHGNTNFAARRRWLTERDFD